jgi:MraZ protein
VSVVFLGTHTPRLDEKGRVILPAKFRDELQGGLVITRGQDRCLYVFPKAGFDQLTSDFRGTAFGDAGKRTYARMLFSGASDEVPDKQGRVTLPPMLREYANLGRDCVVIGAMDRVEIWDAQAWNDFSARHEDEFAATPEAVISTDP